MAQQETHIAWNLHTDEELEGCGWSRLNHQPLINQMGSQIMPRNTPGRNDKREVLLTSIRLPNEANTRNLGPDQKLHINLEITTGPDQPPPTPGSGRPVQSRPEAGIE